MKQPPTIWTLASLMESAKSTSVEIEPGKWVPMRPLGGIGIPSRIRAAIKVFKGEADAVIWPDNQ